MDMDKKRDLRSRFLLCVRINHMTPLIFISVFTAILVTDVLWALCLSKVAKKSPLLAVSYCSPDTSS
jgi:hypothetical protein